MKKVLINIAERAVKTFCQSVLAVLVGAQTGLLTTDWVQALSIGLMATVLSILTSVSSAIPVASDTPTAPVSGAVITTMQTASPATTTLTSQEHVTIPQQFFVPKNNSTDAVIDAAREENGV